MNIPQGPLMLRGSEERTTPTPASPAEATRMVRNSPGPLGMLTPAVWTICLLGSLAMAALVTLTPKGTGWAWGSPVVELRWYLTGLGSAATMIQLIGNLALLAVPAALVVLRWPAWGRPRLLTAAFFPVGTCIELLQWALPLGRVVSPLDAVLNATGAVASGLVVAHLLPRAQYGMSLHRDDDGAESWRDSRGMTAHPAATR